jgi:hypothetical protein
MWKIAIILKYHLLLVKDQMVNMGGMQEEVGKGAMDQTMVIEQNSIRAIMMETVLIQNMVGLEVMVAIVERLDKEGLEDKKDQ